MSDGILSSSISYLRLSIFELQLRLINNSGVTVAEKSSSLITTSSLLFETNADDPFLSVKYEVRFLLAYISIAHPYLAQENYHFGKEKIDNQNFIA